MKNRRFLILLICFTCICRSVSGTAQEGDANDLSAGSNADGQIDSGMIVDLDGTSIKLPPPTLAAGLTEQQQRELIEPLLNGLAFSQFSRDSVVAPVRINLQYIKDSGGQRIGHDVHLLFMVHEKLAAFSEKDFVTRLIIGPQQVSSDDNSDISDRVLSERGIHDSGDDIHYQKQTFELLDKIRVTGVFRIARTTNANQNRIDVRLVPEFDNRWQSIDRPETNPIAREASYTGFQGWLTVTSMSGMDAVLLEARLVMHEPAEWFTGENYLRSKLPLVLQEAARDLRRKLKTSN